jgi:hypothetical protein
VLSFMLFTCILPDPHFFLHHRLGFLSPGIESTQHSESGTGKPRVVQHHRLKKASISASCVQAFQLLHLEGSKIPTVLYSPL